MGQCVIHAISSQYLAFVGSAPSVLTTICVQFAITVTNTICGIVFSGLTLLGVKGLYNGFYGWLFNLLPDICSYYEKRQIPLTELI